MKRINIKKTLKTTNDSFEVRYEGISKDENFDLNKVKMLLEDFVNNHMHNDMIENVTIVRTMLKDCEEKLLVIFCVDEKGSEFVKYVNSDLLLYEKIKREENCKYNNRYKIKYEPFSGIKLDYNNYKSDVASLDGRHFVTKEVNQLLEDIYSLNNIKAIKLNKYEKTLIEIYKLFFNENPDFTNKEINTKIQAMMSILSAFGISLPGDYSFDIYGKKTKIYSGELTMLVDRLYPFGKVDSVEDNIILNKEIEKAIRIIGQCIREKISNEQNLNKAIEIIGVIIYAKMYCLSSSADVDRVSEFTERPVEEVETSLKLAKKIKNKIENEIN